MTYVEQVKHCWNLYGRRVRLYKDKGEVVIAVYWNKRLGLTLKTRVTSMDKAKALAAKIQLKDLINTTCWNKIYYPLNYKMWNTPFYINA